MSNTIDYRELANIAERMKNEQDLQYQSSCRELAEKMGSGHRDELRNLVRNGPVHDGDVLSKHGRDCMLNWRLASKAIVKGEEGYQVATYRGGAVLRSWEDVEKPRRRRLIIPTSPPPPSADDDRPLAAGESIEIELGKIVNLTSLERPHLEVVQLLVNTVRQQQGRAPLDLFNWKPEDPKAMLVAFGPPSVPPIPIWLRSEGDYMVVLVEAEKGAWVEVIREHVDRSGHAVSHIKERGGIASPPSTSALPAPAIGGDR